ncbi:DUF4190 domain-containing protein [Streptomyces djakartensis]|uniref:DUF4190 domain-containing protein n=1 Tax=Streptomyces djakartensis TaxID=68193 RepID=A0ABQ3AHZ4_9ACTN|nr:DUF4190 domain-containing protein [Streptomyces djakartensis]GGY50705.1 hypothetical protein GCM10010384_65910 [Streptomyces djakartensis]
MTDATQPDGGGHDPWAPPESKPSLEKGQTQQPPSVHDQATVTSMPGAGFTPPADTGAVPPPPVAPTGPATTGGYGYPGYPQGGYGWPGMPPAPQNGMGIAAMVLGIVSCTLFCLYGVVSLVTGILAVVFGIKGRKRADAGVATNHGQAQAGLIMGIIGIILGIAVIVLIAVGITAAINSDRSDDDPYYGARGPAVTAPSHH